MIRDLVDEAVNAYLLKSKNGSPSESSDGNLDQASAETKARLLRSVYGPMCATTVLENRGITFDHVSLMLPGGFLTCPAKDRSFGQRYAQSGITEMSAHESALLIASDANCIVSDRNTTVTMLTQPFDSSFSSSESSELNISEAGDASSTAHSRLPSHSSRDTLDVITANRKPTQSNANAFQQQQQQRGVKRLTMKLVLTASDIFFVQHASIPTRARRGGKDVRSSAPCLCVPRASLKNITSFELPACVFDTHGLTLQQQLVSGATHNPSQTTVKGLVLWTRGGDKIYFSFQTAERNLTESMDLFLIQMGYEHVAETAMTRKKRLESTQKVAAPVSKSLEIVLKEEVEEREEISPSRSYGSPMGSVVMPAIGFDTATSSDTRNVSPDAILNNEVPTMPTKLCEMESEPQAAERAFYQDPAEGLSRDGSVSPLKPQDRIAEPTPVAEPKIEHLATGLVLATLMASCRREGSQLSLALLSSKILPSIRSEPSMNFLFERRRVQFFHHVCREVAIFADDIKKAAKGSDSSRYTKCWFAYDIHREMARQRLSEKWGMSHMNANFTKCPTYPTILVEPKDFCDDSGTKPGSQVFSEAFSCRSKGRVQTLTFYNAFSGAAIVRCAQPLWTSGSTCREKEISAYRKTALASPLVVFDLRPFANAAANLVKGGTYEVSRDGVDVRFGNIPNIKVVTSAHDKLMALCQLGAPRIQWYRDAKAAHTSAAIYMAECEHEANFYVNSPSSPNIRMSPTASTSAFPIQQAPSSPALLRMRPPERLPSTASLDQLDTAISQPKSRLMNIATMLGVASSAPPAASQVGATDSRDGSVPFDASNRKAVTTPSQASKAIAATEWIDCLYLILASSVEVAMVVAGSTAYLHSPFLSHPVLSAILSEHEGGARSAHKGRKGMPSFPSNASLTSPYNMKLACTPKGTSLSTSLPVDDVLFSSETNTPSRARRPLPKAPSITAFGSSPTVKMTTGRAALNGSSLDITIAEDTTAGTTTASRAERARNTLRSNFALMSDDVVKDYCNLSDAKLLTSGRRSGTMAKEHFGKHAIVHCSDGWDRTSQVCALSQIMLDPYFRTIEGFCVLIEKDFISFGHQFRLRSDFYTRHSGDIDGQTSPIFMQFLDCVHQLLVLYPKSFEFNENFLLFILDVFHAGATGSFVANNMLEITLWKLKEESISLWQLVSIILTAQPFSSSSSEGKMDEEHTPPLPSSPKRTSPCEQGAVPTKFSADAVQYSGFFNPFFVDVTVLPRFPRCERCARKGLSYNDLHEGLIYCAKHQAEDFKRTLLLRPPYTLTAPISPLTLRLWEGYFFRNTDSSNGRGLRAQLFHTRLHMDVDVAAPVTSATAPLGLQVGNIQLPLGQSPNSGYTSEEVKRSQVMLQSGDTSGETLQQQAQPYYTPSWSSAATPQTPVVPAGATLGTASALFPALPLGKLNEGVPTILPTVAPAVPKVAASSVMAGFDDEWNS